MQSNPAASYRAPRLYIGGEWRTGSAQTSNPIINPATEEVMAELRHASAQDLEAALVAVEQGFAVWRKTPAAERQRILLRGMEILRSRREEVAYCLTLEQGKPLAQARSEVDVAAGMVQWYAEQARRAYGRILPGPAEDTDYEVRKEPVGPCLLLSPWNVPLILAARKIGGALAAGCSCIIKPPEETPAAVAKMVECFIEAGVPPGVINLVFGIPQAISEQLIASDIIRKVSFTGSVGVGQQLARLAAGGLKRMTLELGGHSPVIVFDDVDVDACVRQLVAAKFRNAGQLCHAPTRFFVQKAVYGRFVDRFAQAAAKLQVGDGLDERTEMGPLANARRVSAISELVEATKAKATLVAGGSRVLERGYFFSPTVFADVELDARAMRDEPFGPIALIRSFDMPAEALQMANATRFGLGSYVFTDSARLQRQMVDGLRVGSVAINSTIATVAEAPFGGVGDSGYGYESGEEGLEGYLHTKFVHRTQAV
ncbi:MAG: NAD-dependent succinate-semialdehyde dehydrogenase [Ramlibacter sp.]|jgi:succinate-semialdehyde dehydrogenase/glutarate-semialdehyde dehydrogenase|uniref:NAD-dependent succinate-semialdehyde dehydrogenase n=1 Tax=Ramlibacter sp. TaxID=1917967 RepID=UPI002623BDA0|nr:NAD-dependent succinate-semialdehyde dehydrogenase [Ramlibacter sp.]MDB5751206.1 NAD-dependent succinate-semialdehyde dehydrogenase [Ramlibacter sp.]